MADREHYSGNSSYQFVNQLIKNRDRELLIVSPYISNHYTRMLLKEAGRKRIRIITSEISLGYKGSMLKGLHKGNLVSILVFTLYFAILDAITIYLKFFYISIAIALLFLIATYLTVSRRRRAESNILLKTTGNDFVHEKMYISDSMAIIGSANLTFSGMHKNIEHVEVIKDRHEIAELKRHFNSMWEKYE